MLNMVNAVDGSNHECLFCGAVCHEINEIREDIKNKMKENKDIDMTDEDEKDLGILHIVLFVGVHVDMIIRMKQTLGNVRKWETAATVRVHIQVVPIAFVL